MIKRIEDLPDNVLGYEAIGKVTDKDYEEIIIPEVERIAKSFDNIRFLYLIGDKFEGFTPMAMWDDAKTGLKNLTRWEKVALVSDVDWIKNGVKVFGHLISAEVKVFDLGELPEARKWIVE